MRWTFFVTLFLAFTTSNAATYYVSSSQGSDNRSILFAQSPLTPWQSLTKINATTFAPGDTILFKRGDVFYGGLTVNQSGTLQKPVVFGAYGVGEKPVITGLTKATNWVKRQGFIFESSSLSYPTNLNVVLVDNAPQEMGRYPKAGSNNGGWLTNQSHVGHASLTSNEIASLPSFVGGEIIIKKLQYILDKGKVTYQTSATVGIDPYVAPNHPTVVYEIMDNHGFFFQNHINTLTQPKEWCYDNSNKKILMHSPGSSIVQVSTVENLVMLNDKHFVHFDNISFTGANSYAINIGFGSSNISIKNCDITFTGINAINVEAYSWGDVIVDGCNISYTNNNAIEAKSTTNWLIQNNTITNTALVEGMGLSGDGQYNAISYTGDGSLIQYNRIINTGYLGIHFTGNNTTVKNNYIDSFVMIKGDGGGIYTYGETTKTNRIVTGNIVLNGIGNLFGINNDMSNPYSGQVHGIYMDGGTANVSITNNTVSNSSHSGIWLSSPKGITVTGNTLYNNCVAQLKVAENVDEISNLIVKKNFLFATDSAKLVASFLLGSTPLSAVGNIDSNYYARPLYEPGSINTQGYPLAPTFFNYPGGGVIEAPDFKFYSLDTWQALSKQDANTSKSPVAISDLSKIRFEYNASSYPKSIFLKGNCVDVTNCVFKGQVTLAPYSSIILITDGSNGYSNWIGRTSDNWDTPSNWDNNTVPTNTSDVYISADALNMPLISSTSSTINSLVIAKGAILNVNRGATLSITGSFENNAAVIGKGDVVLNGTTKQSIRGDGTITNLEIKNTAGVDITPGSQVYLNGVLKLTAGELATSNGLTLKSTAENTARVAPITSGTITGNVTVEQYIPAINNVGYRFISPVVSTTTSIKSNWQEGANNTTTSINNDPVPAYGTHITGSNTGTNGFDATLAGRPSLFTFNSSTQAWQSISNTNINTLDAKKGYLIFTRGSRSVNLNESITSTVSTTLRATGTLLTGSVSLPTQGNGKNSLIGNPYASPINWTKLYEANSNSFEKFYTVWDPNLGTSGGYVTVDISGTTSIVKSTATTEIKTGQAFMVKAKKDAVLPTFNIEESHKLTTILAGSRLPGFATKFYTSLFFTDQGGKRKLLDGVLARFDSTFAEDIDGDDAWDVANFDEDIAIKRDGKMLSIESRPISAGNDTLFLNIENLKPQSYEWQFDPTNFETMDSKKAFLKDNFLGTETPIALTGTTLLNFDVTSNTASSAADRFYVVLKSMESLPVKFVSVNATQQNDGVNVSWKTAEELDIVKYEVEKSLDGRAFSRLTTQEAKRTATAINNYSWLDNNVNSSANYYRIKSISKTGKFEYSKVVRVLIGTGSEASIKVYPNPVIGNVVKLDIAKLVKGNYVLELSNANGQVAYKEIFTHNGSLTVKEVKPSQKLTPGIYQLKLTGNSLTFVHRLIAQ